MRLQVSLCPLGQQAQVEPDPLRMPPGLMTARATGRQVVLLTQRELLAPDQFARNVAACAADLCQVQRKKRVWSAPHGRRVCLVCVER
jgi:hypothetical protein